MVCKAFIFARGGSKGLPRKNVKLLNGKPLIQYSIETAFACPEISSVYVSTDDSEIADVARKCGAVVINRPSELASDTAPEWAAWQHAVSYVKKDNGESFTFVSLPCTSPLRSVLDVQSAIERQGISQNDVCISVTEASRSPYFNMVTLDAQGQVEVVLKPNGRVARRQDAPKVFDITTVVYVTSSEFILSNSGVFDGRVVAVDVPKGRAVDIDDIYDFLLAEAIMTQRECEQ